MIHRLISISTTDPDDARKKKLLNILLLGLGLLTLILAVIMIVSILDQTAQEGADLVVYGGIALLLGMIVIFVLNRSVSGKIAATLFLILITGVMVFSDSAHEVSNGRSLFIFTIPIIMASVLLTPASSFIFGLVSSLIISALAISVKEEPNAPAIAGYFLVALIAWISSRNLEQALQELRSINLNLDKVVEEKTKELATTLSRELILAGRNQAILDSIADGVIVFDEFNTAILANPALSKLADIPIQGITDRKITDFIQSDLLSPSTRGTLLGMLENPQTSATGVRVDWGNKTLSTSFARVRDTDGKNIGTVAVFRDVTHEVELEKMKNTFIGIVSHELRTPLNAILGYAEILKEGVYGSVTEKQKNISERIMANSSRLLHIVSDLLDEVQIEAGKLKIQMTPCKPADLLDNLHSVMDKITADKGLEFITELDPSMPPVLMGDSQRLQQIMVNLSNNAVKFTDKGSIRVRLSKRDEQSWQIQTFDTGEGIPEDAKEYIFESFRQVTGSAIRKHGGVGLGLSIVKHLVELMKGKISVESKISRGSIFTVTLPLAIPVELESITIRK